MPRKDPHTGCMVMTLDEFAAKEGTTVSGLLEPVFAELDSESKVATDKILAHPLDFLAGFADDDEYPAPKWKAVIGLPTVKVSYGMSRSSEAFSGLVLADDGKKYRVAAGRSSWSGSYSEPPDEDESLDWKEEA